MGKGGKNKGVGASRGISLTPKKSPKPPQRNQQRPTMKLNNKVGTATGVTFSLPLVSQQTNYDPTLPVVPARKARSPSAHSTPTNARIPSIATPGTPGIDQTWNVANSPGMSSSWFTVSTPIAGSKATASSDPGTAIIISWFEAVKGIVDSGYRFVVGNNSRA